MTDPTGRSAARPRPRIARRRVASPTVTTHRTPASVRLLAFCIVALLVAEVGTRLVDEHLPAPAFEDRDEEVVTKRDQMRSLAPDGAQLVFLGASGVDAGIDPVTFDEHSTRFDRSYNAALIGTSLTYQEDWIDDLVLEDTGAEVAVVGLSPLEVVPAVAPLFFPRAEAVTPAQEEVLEIHARSRFDALDTGILATTERHAERRSELVRYRASLRSPRLVADAIMSTLTGDGPRQPLTLAGPPGEPNTATGQTRLFFERQMGTVAPRLVAGLNEGLAGSIQFDRIGVALDELRDQVQDVFVFLPPIALDALRSAGTDVTRYLDVRDTMVDDLAAGGYQVVDFTEEPFAPELFSDPLHLNEEGSVLLSQQVAFAVDRMCAAEVSCGR